MTCMIPVSTLAMLAMVCVATTTRAQQIEISEEPSPSTFALVGDVVSDLVTDAGDATVVGMAANLLAEDMERVTGCKPRVLANPQTAPKHPVIIGTIGKSRFIDLLIKSGKLDVSKIRGQWESFVITVIENPSKGIEEALVIAGSDRRGTAYGVLTLSEAIGVSPWYYWADVPTAQKKQVHISRQTIVQGPPTIKYRGIFINDEDWGLFPWAAKNFEKDLGDIGPKTYAQICELLLRLKANMMAPAMHSCTGAFYSHAESKVVADRYGIIMTTSHCEPLLFNNAAKSEWDKERDGEWNYATNKKTILKKLDARVREASTYENIYTVGMRGLHDEGMRGNLSKSEQVNILERLFGDQRDILKKHLDKRIEDIPQIFVPYKETMGLYNRDLRVPDDVTLVWVDDNFGYIRRLSNPEEQKRSGGSGVYYHTSYLGVPHDNLWLCTTPPVQMYAELKKAYDTGADRYWLVNIGDIKPAELAMQTFFDFAWNVGGYDYESINRHQSRMLADIFGAEHEAVFQDILDTYYRLAWSRKPEFMGWERQWDAAEFRALADTEYSFENYNDAQQRLADYQRISDLTDQISDQLPEELQPAFFELVGYPVKGSYQMSRKFLLAQLNHELVKGNKMAAANWAADQAKAAYDEINRLTGRYNTMLDGKWNGMMMVPPGLVAKYHEMPRVEHAKGTGSEPVDLTPQESKSQLEGCTVIDLGNIKKKVALNGHTLRLIEGLGYDGVAVQLGEATQKTVNAKDLNGTRVEYEFTAADADTVKVHIYSIPFFPLYDGKSTQFGISVDGQSPFIARNEPKEFSRAWKDQVLRNSAVAVAEFPLKKTGGKHTLTLTCGDPGVMIQRIVIDWGGLKDTYVGPSALLAPSGRNL